MGYTRDVLEHYTITGPMSETDVLAAAEDILRRRLERQGTLSSPRDSATFLRMRLSHLLHEEFHAVWLDSRYQILAVDKLFNGTIDGASVHPREVVRCALRHNAAAVIFAHNHPSGNPEPSAADRALHDCGQRLNSSTCDCLITSSSVHKRRYPWPSPG